MMVVKEQSRVLLSLAMYRDGPTAVCMYVLFKADAFICTKRVVPVRVRACDRVNGLPLTELTLNCVERPCQGEIKIKADAVAIGWQYCAYSMLLYARRKSAQILPPTAHHLQFDWYRLLKTVCE